jgi:hypothetical protein
MKLKLDSNFCELLSAFRACSVRYLIVGGWAASIHAEPRATKGMDIFVSPEPSNLEAVYKALLQFGAPLKNMDESREQDVADVQAIRKAQQRKHRK